MIEIKMQFTDVAEMLKTLARLNCSEEKLSAAVDKALGELVPQAEAARPRARRSKAEAHQEAGAGIAAAVAQTMAAPAEAPAPAPVPPAQAPVVPEKDECSKALVAFAQRHSKDDAFKLLQKYGAQNVSSVPLDQRVAFLADCRA